MGPRDLVAVVVLVKPDRHRALFVAVNQDIDDLTRTPR
jgi:hypothetical protein